MSISPPVATLSLASASERVWDVVVLGGGPAGAVSARALALNRHSVLLIDRNEFPRRKVCGCCLSGSAMMALSQCGLGGLPERLGALPLHSIKLFMGAQRGTIDLCDSKVVSRESFDSALINAAIESGVEFLPSASARHSIENGDTRSVIIQSAKSSGEVTGRVVIAATGLNNNAFVDSIPGLRVNVSANSRMGLGSSLDFVPDEYAANHIYMASASHGYVGLVRLENGRSNIAAALDPAFIRESGSPGKTINAVLVAAGLPRLDNVESAQCQWHGTPLLTRRRDRLATNRLFVIGDAAGYVEPFTGEGIAWALASGILVAQIAQEGIKQWYSEMENAGTDTYRASIQNRQRPCQIISKVLRSPRLAASAVSLLTKVPSLSRPLMQYLNSPLGFISSRKGASV